MANIEALVKGLFDGEGDIAVELVNLIKEIAALVFNFISKEEGYEA